MARKQRDPAEKLSAKEARQRLALRVALLGIGLLIFSVIADFVSSATGAFEYEIPSGLYGLAGACFAAIIHYGLKDGNGG